MCRQGHFSVLVEVIIAHNFLFFSSARHAVMEACIDSDSHDSVVRDGEATMAPNFIDFVFVSFRSPLATYCPHFCADGMVLSTSESMTGAADRLVEFGKKATRSLGDRNVDIHW